MEFIQIIEIIWKDMVATPWGALLGVFIILIFVFKDQLRDFLSKRVNSPYSGILEQDEYSKKDVLNHPIFRDLNYWINKGIDLVKIDKSYAKELIMKDLLKIKFSVINSVLSNAVKDDSLGSMSIPELKKHFYDTLREINTQKVIGWRKNGIPEVFIKKYLALHQLGQEVVYNTVKIFLTNEIKAENYTRVYLVLSILETQLANIYANAVSTAISMNGDLNGIVYKGVIIGGSGSITAPTQYAIANPVSKDIIENKLRSMLSKYRASRVAIFLFHNYTCNNVFDGKYSSIYEVCSPGVKPEKDLTQYIPTYLISDIIPGLKNNKLGIYSVINLNCGLCKALQSTGTELIAIYPLKDGEKIKGFIGISWNYADRFNKDSSALEQDLKSNVVDIEKFILGNNNENTR